MNNRIVIALALVSTVQMVTARFLERCYDEHGCASCAGYMWCDELKECLRFWESPCEMNETQDELMDYLIGNNDI